MNPEGPGTILLTSYFWNINVIQCAYLVSFCPRGEGCIYTFDIEVCCPEYVLKMFVLYSHLLQPWSYSKLKQIDTLLMKSTDLSQFTLRFQSCWSGPGGGLGPGVPENRKKNKKMQITWGHIQSTQLTQLASYQALTENLEWGALQKLQYIHEGLSSYS